MTELWQDYLNQQVVVDTDSHLSFIGTLVALDDKYVKLAEVAVYDEKVVRVTLEQYLVEALKHGVPSSRRELLVRQHRIVAFGRLADIVKV
jgi:hypothetical protein